MILYESDKKFEQKGCKKTPKFHPTTMPGGHPSKKAHTNANLPGLRNHSQPSPSPSDPSSHPTPPRSQSPSPDRTDEDDSDLELLIHFDSLKVNYEFEGETMDENDQDGDDEISEWEGFQREDLADAMLDMFDGDGEKDTDWLPPKSEAR